MLKRRFIPLCVSAALILGTFTGCGTAGLGYMSVAKESSDIKQFHLTDTVNLDIYQPEYQSGDFVAGIIDTTPGSPQGMQSFKFDIEADCNLSESNNLYVDADIDLSMNGISVGEPVNVKIVDNKVFVSKNVIKWLAIYSTETDLNNGTYSNPNVLNVLSDRINADYIMAYDFGDYAVSSNAEDEIKGLLENYIKTTFNGFNAAMFTKTATGYQVSIDSDSMKIFVEDLFKYVSENKDTVFDGTIQLLRDIGSSSGMSESGYSAEDINAVIDSIEASRNDIYQQIDSIEAGIESGEIDASFNEYAGSKLVNEISKVDDSYESNTELVYKYEGVNVVALTEQAVLTPASVSIIPFTSTYIILDDLYAQYEVVENEVNPVKELTIEWNATDPEYDGYTITRLRLDGTSSVDYYEEMYNIEDRLFAPMRKICEGFGEQVEWDSTAFRAYIVRGDQKIDMTGTIINDRTFIKLRDFEKLGYAVDFNMNGNTSTATITNLY